MGVLKLIVPLWAVGCVALLLWTLLVPQSAEEIGHALDDPTPLLGCYFNGRAKVRLSKDHAEFNGERVPISFGTRKTQNEVFYPSRYPWVDVKQGTFRFKNDRFELLDLEQDEGGEWSFEVWTTDYLETADPEDLKSVIFRRGTC